MGCGLVILCLPLVSTFEKVHTVFVFLGFTWITLESGNAGISRVNQGLESSKGEGMEDENMRDQNGCCGMSFCIFDALWIDE